jgi:hypothetical protein
MTRTKRDAGMGEAALRPAYEFFTYFCYIRIHLCETLDVGKKNAGPDPAKAGGPVVGVSQILGDRAGGYAGGTGPCGLSRCSAR